MHFKHIPYSHEITWKVKETIPNSDLKPTQVVIGNDIVSIGHNAPHSQGVSSISIGQYPSRTPSSNIYISQSEIWCYTGMYTNGIPGTKKVINASYDGECITIEHQNGSFGYWCNELVGQDKELIEHFNK